MNSPDEFERVALVHTQGLLRFSRRLTGSPAEAEDLVQEALLRAWRNFHRFQPDTNARAWLFRIVVNTWNGWCRKRRPVLLPAPGKHSDFHEALRIEEALDRLPLEQRLVVGLVIVEGFTCRETADVLEIPIGTVMSRLSRARRSLQESLGGSEAASAASFVGEGFKQ